MNSSGLKAYAKSPEFMDWASHLLLVVAQPANRFCIGEPT
jgi:hypothetical protein